MSGPTVARLTAAALTTTYSFRTGLVIFDSVPGGAGGALRIANALDGVARAALDRVSNCDCGEETSCYGCLRSFRNQRFHEELSRRAAIRFLEPMLRDRTLTGVS